MTQRTAFTVATLLTVFLVVVIVGVGIRVAQQAAPAPSTAATVTEPVAASVVVADPQTTQAQREAAYQAALEQANQRLDEANRQLQAAYRQQQALAEQLQRLSQPGVANQPVVQSVPAGPQMGAVDAEQSSLSLTQYDPRSGYAGERHGHHDDHGDDDDEHDDD